VLFVGFNVILGGKQGFLLVGGDDLIKPDGPFSGVKKICWFDVKYWIFWHLLVMTF